MDVREIILYLKKISVVLVKRGDKEPQFMIETMGLDQMRLFTALGLLFTRTGSSITGCLIWCMTWVRWVEPYNQAAGVQGCGCCWVGCGDCGAFPTVS